MSMLYLFVIEDMQKTNELFGNVIGLIIKRLWRKLIRFSLYEAVREGC